MLFFTPAAAADERETVHQYQLPLSLEWIGAWSIYCTMAFQSHSSSGNRTFAVERGSLSQNTSIPMIKTWILNHNSMMLLSNMGQYKDFCFYVPSNKRLWLNHSECFIMMYKLWNRIYVKGQPPNNIQYTPSGDWLRRIQDLTVKSDFSNRWSKSRTGQDLFTLRILCSGKEDSMVK